MNLYHLRYFQTLAHLEHYTKAAEALGITQPSLSHAISLLEGELGVKLFEKEGRNVVLTRYGKLFLDDIERAINIIDESSHNLRGLATGEGTIQIGCLRVLGAGLVPKLMNKYCSQNPDKKIDFTLSTDTGMSNDIIQGLKDRHYDVAFCSKIDNEPLVEFTPVATQNMVLITPLDHPLADRASIRLDEVVDYPFIYFNQKTGLRTEIDALFKQAKAFPKDIVYEVEEDDVAAGLVANGFGIAVTHKIKVLKSMKLKIIPIIWPQWNRTYYMATLKNSYKIPVLEDFIKFVKDDSKRVMQKILSSSSLFR